MPDLGLSCDVAIVGRGIAGLAHAYAAVRAGQSVIVIDRHPRALGASIRNFGFITVTGQARGEMWSLAMRTRDIWNMVAPRAGIAVLQTGLSVFAHRPEAEAVLAAFMRTEMGEGCELLTQREWSARNPGGRVAAFGSALVSPHELRVEPRHALPLLGDWLAREHDVRFMPPATVTACEPGCVVTSAGRVRAEQIFVCPGDDLTGLFPEVMAAHGVTRCKLHMLRLGATGARLHQPVMADLSLVRYEGYAALPEAEKLRARLERERAAHLAAGVHVIAVQSADGTLVVGDTHEYGDAPTPFQPAELDRLVLDAFEETLPDWGADPVERWTGTYAWSPQGPWFSEEVAPGVHVTVITCGAGMSTSFAIGERVIGEALGTKLKDVA